MPNSATEETSSQSTAQQTFQEISPVPTGLLSDLEKEHEDSIENDEETGTYQET